VRAVIRRRLLLRRPPRRRPPRRRPQQTSRQLSRLLQRKLLRKLLQRRPRQRRPRQRRRPRRRLLLSWLPQKRPLRRGTPTLLRRSLQLLTPTPLKRSLNWLARPGQQETSLQRTPVMASSAWQTSRAMRQNAQRQEMKAFRLASRPRMHRGKLCDRCGALLSPPLAVLRRLGRKLGSWHARGVLVSDTVSVSATSQKERPSALKTTSKGRQMMHWTVLSYFSTSTLLRRSLHLLAARPGQQETSSQRRRVMPSRTLQTSREMHRNAQRQEKKTFKLASKPRMHRRRLCDRCGALLGPPLDILRRLGRKLGS